MCATPTIMDMAGELSFIYKLRSALKRKADDPVNLLVMPKCSRTEIVGQGPKAANAHMRFDKMKPGEKLDWLEEARVMAILGSCSRTMPSLRSGVRCFLAFAGYSFVEIFACAHAIRCRTSWKRTRIAPKVGHTSCMVHVVPVYRHLEELRRICEDMLHTSWGRH